MPHATWGTRVPDLPCFCGPAVKNRRAARDPGDPGLGSAMFLRARGQKSAWATRVSRALNLRGFVRPLRVQVARFAGGTRFWLRGTAKTRHIRDPGRPVCVRHAVSGAPDRKNPAHNSGPEASGGGAGKPREHELGKSTSEMYT